MWQKKVKNNVKKRVHFFRCNYGNDTFEIGVESDGEINQIAIRLLRKESKKYQALNSIFSHVYDIIFFRYISMKSSIFSSSLERERKKNHFLNVFVSFGGKQSCIETVDKSNLMHFWKDKTFFDMLHQQYQSRMVDVVTHWLLLKLCRK